MDPQQQPTPVPAQDAQPVAPTSPAPTPVAQSTSAAPMSASPVGVAPATNVSSVDSKVFQPKYLAIIFGTILIYNLIAQFIGRAAWLIIIAVAVYAYMQVAAIKKRGPNSLQDKDKTIAVFAMAVDPLIAQALYYYGLKSKDPQAASIFLKLGWKVLGLSVLIWILLSIVLATTL